MCSIMAKKKKKKKQLDDIWNYFGMEKSIIWNLKKNIFWRKNDSNKWR